MDSLKPISVLLFALCLVITPPTAFTQRLNATKCAAILPTARTYVTALYDNDDSIYLFGGFGGSSLRETLKYSVSMDTLEPAGELPLGSYAGGAVMNKMNDIIYIPAERNSIHCDATTTLLLYSPKNQNFTPVAGFHQDQFFATIKTDENTALLLGGYYCRDKAVVSLDLNNFQTGLFQDVLPSNVARFAGAIWATEKKTAYIFATNSNRDGLRTLKFSTSTNRSEELPSGRVQDFDDAPRVVYDGRYGYIVGATGDYSDGILQFDPDTETVSYIRVGGYPGGSRAADGPYTAPGIVYVEKLRRIYMFGGYHPKTSSRLDGIWYIDLSPSVV